MSMEPTIRRLIEKFEHKVAADDSVREKVMPVHKTVSVDLGEEKYSFEVKDAAIINFKDEALENADLFISCSPENFQALVDGDLRPMRAYVTKKLVIKGKIEDIMHLKSLF